MPFQLSREERQLLGRVILDAIPQEADAIQTQPLNLGSPFLPAQRPSHPLEHQRNLFLERLSQYTEEKAEEIRGIAWVVVHKYAKRVYNLDFGVPDGEYLG